MVNGSWNYFGKVKSSLWVMSAEGSSRDSHQDTRYRKCSITQWNTLSNGNFQMRCFIIGTPSWSISLLVYQKLMLLYQWGIRKKIHTYFSHFYMMKASVIPANIVDALSFLMTLAWFSASNVMPHQYWFYYIFLWFMFPYHMRLKH